MMPVSGSKYIIVLSFLVIALLFAGCTEQPGAGTPVPTPTPTPTPTIISPATNATPDLQDLRDQVALIAAGYAQEINRTALSAAISEGPNSTSFAAVAGQLRALRLKDSRLVYVYLVEQQNGTVRFLITGHHGMPGDAPFLSLYPDAPVELTKPITAPIGVGPYTDSWGTFISGYAPVNMSPDTRMVLIGVDISPDLDLLRFVSDAKAYALANGKTQALEAFNNQSGPFVSGELYIFAYDYNGTVLAWPYRPDQIGVNRLNATDPTGMYHVQNIINTAKSGGGMVDYYTTNPITNKTERKISYVTDVDGTWMLGAGRYMEPGPVVLGE